MTELSYTRRTRLRSAVVALAAVGVAGLLGTTVAGADGRPSPRAGDDPAGGGQPEAASSVSDIDTVPVERRDLVREESLDATVGHATATELVSPLAGTVTDLPVAGDVIEPGQTLFEIDEDPVVLFTGDTPMWRPLHSGVDDGRDVEQLEQGLADLGFGDDLTVDGEWTWETTRALRDWQDSLGFDDDGRLELGEVAFAPGPVRIHEVLATPGSDAMAPMVAVTGTDQIVQTLIHPRDQDLVGVDDEIEVVLTDGTTVSAVATEVAVVPNEDDMLPVTLAVDERSDLPDGTPVEAIVDEVVAEDVLAVPVTSLVALLEGGHAVEVVADDGSTSLRAVELGAIVDGWVEITGQIEAGDQVVNP